VLKVVEAAIMFLVLLVKLALTLIVIFVQIMFVAPVLVDFISLLDLLLELNRHAKPALNQIAISVL